METIVKNWNLFYYSQFGSFAAKRLLCIIFGHLNLLILVKASFKYLFLILCIIVTAQYSTAQNNNQDIIIPDTFPNSDPFKLENPNQTEIFPPALIGGGDIKKPEYTENPNSISENEISELRSITQNNTDLREIIGDDFIYISSGRSESNKANDANPTNAIVITYFSYTNNRAYDVLFVNGGVKDVIEYRDQYQPSTSIEEIERARKILLSSEYREIVEETDIRAIITEGEMDTKRYIYVTFRGAANTKVLSALVNLTDSNIEWASKK